MRDCKLQKTMEYFDKIGLNVGEKALLLCIDGISYTSGECIYPDCDEAFETLKEVENHGK